MATDNNSILLSSSSSSSTSSKSSDAISSTLQKLASDRSNKILISILSISIFLILSIIITSIIVSFLRREQELTTINFNVGSSVLWGNTYPICDPNNIITGSYRVNFYNQGSAFFHTIMIYQEEKEEEQQQPIYIFLKKIIVPQETSINLLNFSYVLKNPGTYIFENFSNNKKIGQIIFKYPNECTVSIL